MEKFSKKQTALLFLGLIMAVLLGVVGRSSVAEAAVAKPTEANLVIHKLKFDGSATVPDIHGDGTVLPTLPAGAQPAEGVRYAVVSLKGSILGNSPSQEEALAYYETAKLLPLVFKTEGVTNAQGIFDTGTIPADRYLAVELEGSLGTEKISAPVVVTLPTMSVDGTSWNNNVHIYTKDVVTLGAAKIKKVKQDSTALSGATFSLYKKGLLLAPDVLIKSGLVSQADGFTDTVGNLTTGNYYFVETAPAGGYLLNGQKVTFTITEANNAYDINGALVPAKVISASLVNYLKPTLKKELLTEASTDIGKTVQWKITTDIPSNINEYKKYIISDTLASTLTYKGNIKVLVDGVALNTAYYTVVSLGNQLDITFISELLPLGNAGLAGHQKIEITFDSVINATATPGVPIPNNATLYMDNGYGTVTSTQTTPPTVVTGGRKVIKVNGMQAPLAGAEFIIHKLNGSTPVYLSVNPLDKSVSWVANRANATTLKSPSNGQFEAFGLAYGTYYLTETKAPSGYNLLTEAQSFVIDQGSYSDASKLVVVNTNSPSIPITGGIGTVLFFSIGLILMGLAIFYYRNRYSHS